MNIDKEELCPCSSGKKYGECCEPIIAGAAKARTAEALMRARYTSYVVGRIRFLKDSAVQSVLHEFDEESSLVWSEQSKWHGLEITRTEAGGENDERGVVEFHAMYTAGGQFCDHHEISTFVRENGEWKFEDGEMVANTPSVREEPKIGRNDPCPCGSGKKYKKCCGKDKD